MGVFEVDLINAGLDLRDPRDTAPSSLPAALNVIPTGGVLRTVPGYRPLSNLAYAGGSTSKVALWFRRLSGSSQDAGMILATKQVQITGTATATKANHLVDSGASFHPGLVHRVVKNTTDGTYTVVVRFVSPTTLELADDYFENTEGYAILNVGDTIAGIWYSQVGMGLPADLTVLGEIDSTDSLYPVTLLGRLFLLTGADRGYVLHGRTFRPLGMLACRDNNSLSVDVSQSGSHTGKYKFALVWYEAETYRISPEYIIEDATTEDGYYNLAGKKIVLDTGTLPTNTVDTWTHYRLYVKKDEWADYHFGVEVEKGGSTFEESETDGTLLARETLAQNRIAPSGFTYGTEWQDRLALWGHHGLEITGGISVSNGSTLVTLGGGVTTDEWMRGARLFMAASGSSPLHGFEIKAIVDSTTLELYFAWDGDTISAGDGRIVPYPSRVVIGLSGYGNCEFTSPWHYIDVNPDDGDMVVTCFEHAGDLYVLKRHSMWRLTLDQIIDQLGGEIPTVLITTRKIAEIGCCGPRAIATDGRGAWYWLAGADGLMRFDGMRPTPAPTKQGALIDPYWAQQEEANLWDVRLANNTAWRCLEIHGLTRPADGADGGLRYYHEDGRFVEMDTGIGSPVFGTTGFQAPVSVPGEFVYWTVWNTKKGGHEIWRLDISDQNNLTPELFVAAQKHGWDKAGVRDIAVDRDGNPVVIRVQVYVAGADLGFGYNQENAVVTKYDRGDGAALWSSPDLAQYIIAEEKKAGGVVDCAVPSLSPSLGVSEKHVAAAFCGFINSGGTYTRHLWLILLEAATGSIASYVKLSAAYAAVQPMPQHCRTFGVAWSADGNFWVAGTYVHRNDATTWPRDYRCRLYRINENNPTDTGSVDIEVDSHPRTIPLGISYHHSGTSGRLLIPVWHESEVGGDGEMGVAVYDINLASVSSSTYGSPYPHFENGALGAYVDAGNCGIGRTGQRIGWFEQQLEKGLAPASAQAPSNFWLCDGKRLWKCSLDPLSVDPTAVVSSNYDYYAATRRENGDLVYFKPWLEQDPQLVDHLNVKITVADASDGSEKFSCSFDYTQYSGPTWNWYQGLPYGAFGGADPPHQEMPWAAFAVAAYHG